MEFLLDNFIDDQFDKFFNNSLHKIGVTGGLHRYLNNKSNEIKYQLFRHVMKLSMFEFAYSHVYCNQMKIAGDFFVPGIRNGFLQKCFFCCDQAGILRQPRDADLYSQLKDIPNKNLDNENYEPSINEKLDHAKDEGERELTNSNGSNGAITFNHEKCTQQEGKYLVEAFGEEPFTAAEEPTHTKKFNDLSDHLKKHFECFQRLKKNMEEKISVENRKGDIININKTQIISYTVSKTSMNIYRKLKEKTLKLLKGDSLINWLKKKVKGTRKTSTGGKGGKKTRKKIII